MQPDLKVSGLDLSLTSTGVAVYQAGAVQVYRLEPPKKVVGHQRLLWLRRGICDLVRGSTHITAEGAAYGRVNGQHKLGGFWWLTMHCLWMENPEADVVVVPPPELKRYAIGKGIGEKPEIVAAVVRRYPEIAVTSGDTADATVLCAMTLDVLGSPLAEVPKSHREPALKSWPYKRIEEL